MMETKTTKIGKKEYQNIHVISCKSINPSTYECDLYRRVPEGHLERISTVRANKIIAIAPGGFKADKANDELDISYSNGKCMLDILDLSFLGKEYKKIISLLCYEM